MIGHTTYDNLIQFWERIGKSMSHASALATATVHLWPGKKNPHISITMGSILTLTRILPKPKR